MDTYTQIATKIIQEQESLMGPVAWEQASKVPGMHVTDHTVSIDPGTEGRTAVDALVGQYSHLFGRAAKEVCKEAVSTLIADLPPSDIPATLL